MGTFQSAGKLVCMGAVATLPFFNLDAEPAERPPQEGNEELSYGMPEALTQKATRLEQDVYDIFVKVSEDKPPLTGSLWNQITEDWIKSGNKKFEEWIKSGQAKAKKYTVLEVSLVDGTLRAVYSKKHALWGPDYSLSVDPEQNVNITNGDFYIAYKRSSKKGTASDYGRDVSVRGQHMGNEWTTPHITVELETTEEHLSRYVELAQKLCKAYNLSDEFPPIKTSR